MALNRSIINAYQKMHERGWDSMYWAIDLHGVCFPSTYEQGGYRFINDQCKATLQLISSRPESKIILWSGCYPHEQQAIMDFFAENGIKVFAFNQNPEVPNTDSGCFDFKFYFQILLDDKAGFDPNEDWAAIHSLLTSIV